MRGWLAIAIASLATIACLVALTRSVRRVAPASAAVLAATPSPSTPACRIEAMRGTPAPCPLDPRLAHHAARLLGPPLGAFGCFRPTREVAPARVTWMGATASGRSRYRIDTGAMRPTVELDDDATVLLGSAVGRDVRVVAVTCCAPRAPGAPPTPGRYCDGAR
jgi:hypothetical protein